jgi:molybdopterin-guanine dinucleotide biosynthesis protein A
MPANPLPPTAYPATFGLVLAGGRARRMGGADKPLLSLAGTTILERVLSRLAPQCAGVLLNANGDPARFAFAGLPVIADDVPGFAGPLAGVLAGLDFLAERRPGIEWLVTVPGDCPFLPGDLVARLHATRERDGKTLACARSGEWTHPVIGLWPVGLRADLRRALVGEGESKVGAFMARHGVAMAEWPTEPVDPFFNVNAPEDVAAAERMAKLAP